MISWQYITPYLIFIIFYMKTPQINSITSELTLVNTTLISYRKPKYFVLNFHKIIVFYSLSYKKKMYLVHLL